MMGALILILLAVLVLPFTFHKVEENLEVFLFLMGMAAALVSGHFTLNLLVKALREPIAIALAVLGAGALFYMLSDRFTALMDRLFQRVSLSLVVFAIIAALGLLSSVITAIIAAIILVELIALLPLGKNQKIVICVIACFSIGFGAVLTPIGEPLATITISKLGKNFLYLSNLLGKYIIPAILVMAGLGALYTAKVVGTQSEHNEQIIGNTPEEENAVPEEESWKGIIIRAVKIYLFVMALVFLGEGFQPLIDTYILGLDNWVLYWVNMVSAVLDNATLAAAELSPQMAALQIKAILMGLLISGGMLVPGNIPNIISASKLKISMTEWAKIGIPLGLIIMTIFYFILF